jgi:hypothetical protein
MAGAGKSGYLKDPQKSIPLGSLIAHFSTTLLYIIFICLFGTVAIGPVLREKMPASGLFVAAIAWPTKWITLIGILFSAIGAAMQCLVRSVYFDFILSAPLLVQALAKDDIIPILRPFAKLHNGEPRLALLFVVIIAEGVVLIGNLDFVATIVTQSHIIAYLFVNLSTGITLILTLNSTSRIL